MPLVEEDAVEEEQEDGDEDGQDVDDGDEHHEAVETPVGSVDAPRESRTPAKTLFAQ